MFLTHLSVHGFKSFAHPITIEFHPGLNVIVGPNGSGKSNIIDALRWVLGDNFREMRVSQGKEVIFHGAAGAKSLGMAFIETQWSDDEEPPFSIGRRIFASGESEYFLNQNRLRLKDLKDELRKLGFLVDSIGITVVDNTKLQNLFDFHPSDKFSLFEMASGTFPVKEKLAEVKSSLNRIIEKISRLKEREIELNLQIEKISEYAKQEERYLLEEQFFIALRKEYFNQLIQQRLKKIKGLEKEKEEIERDLRQLIDEGIRLDNLWQKQQELFQEKKRYQSQVIERLANLREDLRSAEQQVYFHLSEARQREKNKLLIKESLDEFQPKLTLLKKNISEFKNHPLYQETLGELEKKEKDYQKKVSEFRVRKDFYHEQINQLKQTWSRLETSIQYLSEELEVLQREQNTLDFSSEDLIRQIEEFKKRRSILHEEGQQFTRGRAQLKEKIDREKALLVKIQNSLGEYDPEEKIDERIADLFKKLIQQGWPGKVIYALNWIFRDYTPILKTNEDLIFHASSEKSGRSFIALNILPPADYWKIFTKDQIIAAFSCSEIPSVNMISSDGKVVYRRDGSLIFPRKLITHRSGVRFYRSWQTKGSILQKRIQEGEKNLSILLTKENQLEKEIAKIEGELHILQIRYDDLLRERKKKAEKIENINLKRQSFLKEKDNIDTQLSRLVEEKKDIENEINQLEDNLRKTQKKRFDREKLRLTEEKLENEQATLEKQIEKSLSSLRSIELSQTHSPEVWKEVFLKIKKLNEEYQFESSRKEAAFIAVDEIQKKIAEIEYQRKNGKEKQDSLSRRLEKLNLQKEKWSFEIQEFTTRLNEFKEVNTDDISLPPYLDYHHLEQLMAEKETRLKNWDIRRGSISQLRDLQERQNYLQEKIAYFQEVVLQLEKNRIECEQLCHELFYEFLSEANFHFQNNFQRVFNGGRAKIEIEEQNLEIIIQIPGKKKQRLSLLSSGEKALIALCLFFALFKSGGYRFCFFDEVDATLDHFNSIRLAELIKEFSQECQVIIVTHQEEIMEVSDRIIGVTMDEPGISRVVTLSGKNLTLLSSQN